MMFSWVTNGAVVACPLIRDTRGATLRRMEPTPARPKATAKPSAPSPAPRKGGRPRKDDAVRDLPALSIRVDRGTIDRLDAIVTRRNRELAAQGATTSRLAVMAIALREFCDREEAAHPPAGEGAAS